MTGVFLQSVTEWTFRQTAIAFAFHILLGTLASLYYWRKHSSPPSPRRMAQNAAQRRRQQELELVTAGERE